MKDKHDNRTMELTLPTDQTNANQANADARNYTAHLILDDGTTVVWARLTKREAAAIYKLNLRAFSGTHSSADMRRTGWGEAA